VKLEFLLFSRSTQSPDLFKPPESAIRPKTWHLYPTKNSPNLRNQAFSQAKTSQIPSKKKKKKKCQLFGGTPLVWSCVRISFRSSQTNKRSARGNSVCGDFRTPENIPPPPSSFHGILLFQTQFTHTHTRQTMSTVITQSPASSRCCTVQPDLDLLRPKVNFLPQTAAAIFSSPVASVPDCSSWMVAALVPRIRLA